MTAPRKKTAKDENFPVGMLVKPELKPLVTAYYRAARLADDTADNPALSEAQKLERLEHMEAVFLGREEDSGLPEIAALRDIFRQENLDSSLYCDLLEAFRRDARNIQPEIWEQLLDYCKYSAAPVGRFMLAIHDENPSTYLPAASLCAVLQIVNHLQDLKYDAATLKRFYLPKELMAHYQVSNDDLLQPYTCSQLKLLLAEISQKLRGVLADAAVLPSIIRSRRLKAEIGVILSLTNSMIKKIEKGDVLSQKICLSRSDWLRAGVAGLVTGLFVKTKTLGSVR